MKKKNIKLLLLLILINMISGNAFSLNSIDLQLPDIQSETAVLMDADTGQVLYQKDMDKRMYPASITKIMTGMLAMKRGKLTDMITLSDKAVFAIERDSANIALDVGEQITLEQALHALSVASANDAANGIAEYIGGTMAGFTDMLNASAKELGAVNTHFTNANGLPDNNHYTSAYDMALITAAAINVPGFTEIFNTKRYKIPPTNKQPETRIFNASNRFVNGSISYEGTLMSKAGWTFDAQHTLVTAARRNGRTIIAVVMKSADSTVKWSDTISLLDFGFDQFNLVEIPKKDILQAALNDVIIRDKGAYKIDPNTYPAQDVSVLLPKGFSSEDIQFSFGEPAVDISKRQVNLPVCMSFASPDAACVPEEILDTTIKATLRRVSDANDGNSPQQASKASVFKIIIISFLSIIGTIVLLYIILVIRRAVIIRKRRRNRR